MNLRLLPLLLLTFLNAAYENSVDITGSANSGSGVAADSGTTTGGAGGGGAAGGGGGGDVATGVPFIADFTDDADGSIIDNVVWQTMFIPGVGPGNSDVNLAEPTVSSGAVPGTNGAFPSGAVWKTDTDFAIGYHELVVALTTDTPTQGGDVAFLVERFNNATYLGYACTYTVTANDLYSTRVVRYESGGLGNPPVVINISGAAVESAVSSLGRVSTPSTVLFGCEFVTVSGVDRIRSYIGSRAPAIVDYEIGSHASDDPVVNSGTSGFGFFGSATSLEHEATSYRILSAKP